MTRLSDAATDTAANALAVLGAALYFLGFLATIGIALDKLAY